MWLALSIFILTVLTAVVRAHGYGHLATLMYQAYYTIIPNPLVKERRKYKSDTLKLRAQLRATNAHDEFAKWAKIRRRLDASTAKCDKLSSDLAFQRTSFEIKTSLALRLTVYISRATLLIYYRYDAAVVPPKDWLGPLAPLLSLPFSPAGTISVPVWMFVCYKVVELGEMLGREVVGHFRRPFPAIVVEEAKGKTE